MAHLSTSTPLSGGLLNSIGDIFNTIGRTLGSVSVANAKMRQLETLMAMTDEELAERGLRREEIAQHVFGGCYL